MRACKMLSRWLLAWLAVAALPVGAASLNDTGLFQINATVQSEQQVVPRQHVKLEIETATSGWFAQGTRIALPEVAGLVILQNEPFAANASERRNGVTWVTQRWTLDIYPLRAGSFSIGPIALTVGVQTGDGDALNGTVYTQPVSLSVALPGALEDLEEWVASPEFTVTQTFDRAPDALGSLSVGDAVEQVIEFSAEAIPAMMLPIYPQASFDGLATYPQPPSLTSQSNRGRTRATRTARIVYVVEQPGEYRLPDRDFYWWNSTTGALEIVSVPGVTLATGAGSARASDSTAMLHAAAGVAGAIILVALTAYAWRQRKRHTRATRAVSWLRGRWRALTGPALPERLNP